MNAFCKWSKTNSCWYVPCSGEDYLRLKTALEIKAELKIDELKKFLLEKKKSNPAPKESIGQCTINQNKPVAKIEIKRNPVIPSKASAKVNFPQSLSKENSDALRIFNQHLVLKAYSPSTVRTYDNEFRQFLQTIKDKPAASFSPARLKDYFEYCYTKLHLSENTLHSRINSLKFYYEQVLKREKFFWEIPRPKKPLLLPKLLNEDELRKLFNALTNKKHKAMLFTA